MHSASGSSIAIMGLSTGIRSAFECSLRDRSTSSHKGRSDGIFEVGGRLKLRSSTLNN